jgi:hypothetical protein
MSAGSGGQSYTSDKEGVGCCNIHYNLVLPALLVFSVVTFLSSESFSGWHSPPETSVMFDGDDAVFETAAFPSALACCGLRLRLRLLFLLFVTDRFSRALYPSPKSLSMTAVR